MGVVVRRYIDFLILPIRTPLASVLFAAASLLFVHFLNVKYFFTQYKHIQTTTDVPQQLYEGCRQCFIHEEAHTNAHFISCN